MKGKKIILGITGSIAAYKAATLCRLFVKSGAEVQVILTPSAGEFITPLTMSTLSNRPVLCDFYNRDNGFWHSHVEIGLWADLFIVAPASANTIAKMATGVCDNLLLTTYLSVRCPVMVAPAMDVDMYSHVATQRSLARLVDDGVCVVEPEFGELASGLQGKGRMAEPEHIFAKVKQFFEEGSSLEKKKSL